MEPGCCSDAVESVVVSDQAKAFNPLTVAPAKPATSLEDATIGGWGVQLIRTFSDALDYERHGPTNRLIMSFRANSQG